MTEWPPSAFNSASEEERSLHPAPLFHPQGHAVQASKDPPQKQKCSAHMQKAGMLEDVPAVSIKGIPQRNLKYSRRVQK